MEYKSVLLVGLICLMSCTPGNLSKDKFVHVRGECLIEPEGYIKSLRLN